MPILANPLSGATGRRRGDGSGVGLSGWRASLKISFGRLPCKNERGQGLVGKLMQISAPLILAAGRVPQNGHQMY